MLFHLDIRMLLLCIPREIITHIIKQLIRGHSYTSLKRVRVWRLWVTGIKAQVDLLKELIILVEIQASETATATHTLS